MKFDLRATAQMLRFDEAADRVVPPTGFTARLTVFSAFAMAFLAVFAIALSLAVGRVATQWGEDLARSSTVRISAPAGETALQTEAALRVLRTTPGIAPAGRKECCNATLFGAAPDSGSRTCSGRLLSVNVSRSAPWKE